MKTLPCLVAVLFLTAMPAGNSSAYSKYLFPYDPPGPASGMTNDCVLQSYNVCSSWVWIYQDVPGSMWGTVYDPDECTEDCTSGGAIEEIWFSGYCSTSGTPSLDGVAIHTVDAAGCMTGTLWDSGPFTVTNCVPRDRWTRVVPDAGVHVNGERFLVTVTWGTGDGFYLASESGLWNKLCTLGILIFPPPCRLGGWPCMDWDPGVVNSYIYRTDLDGDTKPEDLCDLYGAPDPMAWPYYFPYGYLPNNLMMVVGMDCASPTNVEATSWGHVKALYE